MRADTQTITIDASPAEVFRFVANPGVIDFHLSPAPGIEALAASRVVPNGDGTEYVFTQFQMLGMPDDAFTRQVHALREELAVLKALLEARAVEAAPSCAPVV